MLSVFCGRALVLVLIKLMYSVMRDPVKNSTILYLVPLAPYNCCRRLPWSPEIGQFVGS
jgi:hypothetical protein